MGEILYKNKGIAVYHKLPGEDSEKLPVDSRYHALTRLDKPVEGLLVLSSSGAPSVTHSKSYIAVITGALPAEGVMEDLLFHDKRKNRSFPVKRMRNGVKDARLTYKVLAYNETEDLSLVRIVLDTGRTHQIRVQFASRKHPLWGDGKYGSRHKGNIALCCNHIELNKDLSFDIKPEGEPWSLFEVDPSWIRD